MNRADDLIAMLLDGADLGALDGNRGELRYTRTCIDRSPRPQIAVRIVPAPRLIS